MKRLILCLALVLALSPAHAEESVNGMRTVDEQLSFIDDRAAVLGEALEFGGWDENLTAPAAGDVSYLVPPNLESAVQVDALPESMMGMKFVVLCDDGDALSLYGGIAARLPAEMRAAKQIEADAVFYIRMSLEKSGKTYIPPATSYNRHYDVYAYDLVSGETYLLWSKVNPAKNSGVISQLNGDRISEEDLWYALRPVVLPRTSVDSGGATFAFAITGENCCLVGVEAAEDVTALEIPAEAEGKPVKMIYDCDIAQFASLETVILPASLSIIADSAFEDATISAVEIPDGVRGIGASAFRYCQNLTALSLPEGLQTVGEYAFADMDSLREMVLPATVTEVGKYAISADASLGRVVLGEGMTSVPYGLVNGSGNLLAIYVPASIQTGLYDAKLSETATVYAPEGSYALSLAMENGFACAACARAADMPEVAWGVEGDFSYMSCAGKAFLLAYAGNEARITIPDALGGCPVAEIFTGAFGDASPVSEVQFPECIEIIRSQAFHTGTMIDAYIPNPDASIVQYSFDCVSGGGRLATRIHAPAGGGLEEMAAQYPEFYVFVPTDAATSALALEKLMGDVRATAVEMGEKAAAFWNKFDHEKYAWFARVPEYDMTAPEALAVIRLTPGQYAPFVEAYIDANGFAKSVNAQYDADYAQASLMTNVALACAPAPDGMCAVALLVYRTDILMFTEDEAGNATAALIASTSDIADNFSADDVWESAGQLGLGQIDVEIYVGAEAADLLAALQ